MKKRYVQPGVSILADDISSSSFDESSSSFSETETAFSDSETTSATVSVGGGRGGSITEDIPPHPVQEEEEDSVTTYCDPIRYCVGWLLQISGPEIGKSYEIYSGRNMIGRGERDDVYVRSDVTVSRSQAVVTYDPEENEYSIAPGSGHAITRLNKKRIDFAAELRSGDVIALSKKSVFRFIPACGEDFRWDDTNE